MEKLLTIIHPKDAGSGVRTSNGTRFVLDDGTELEGVTRCVVEYATDCIVTATLDVAIAPQENIEAHPLLSYESLKAAALEYGFELKPLPGFVLSEYQRRRLQAIQMAEYSARNLPGHPCG